MSGDDAYIEDLKILVGQFEGEGLRVKRLKLPLSFDASRLLKNGHRPSFIDAKRTLIELGHPATLSLCLSMVTESDNLVEDGRVTVVGKDLNELPIGRHSFALILLAGAAVANDGGRQAVSRKMSACDLLAGCMARTSVGRIWIRFSQEALDRGLTLEAIGGHYISELKKDRNRFNKVEALLMTGREEHIERLRPLANALAEEKNIRYQAAVAEKMACETGLNCDECPETETCKVLKDAVAVAWKNRNVNEGN